SADQNLPPFSMYTGDTITVLPISMWRGAEHLRPADLRVGIVAAGGLSHIVLNEAFDRQALNALRSRDLEVVWSLQQPLEAQDHMASGTGEVRCWVAAAGALEQLSMQLLRYEPCYRSAAGTGCGMAFALWR